MKTDLKNPYNDVTATVELITPEYAKDLLKKNIKNRNLNNKTVRYYESQIKRGQWVMNGEPIIITKGGVLGDGQHRAWAIVNSNIPVWGLIVRGIPDEAFPTIDTGKSRSNSDILSIYDIRNSKKIAAIISSYKGVCANMVDYRGFNCKDMNISRLDVLNEYNSSPDLYQNILSELLRCIRKVRLLRESEMGGYATYLIKDKKYPFETVLTFFRALHGLDKTENETFEVLRNKIINSLASQYRMDAKLKKALIVKSWNAYISGKSFKVLSWNPEKEVMPQFI